jgi:Zn-dependent peptidase ImmA (M78 family)
MPERIEVNPELLVWARQRSGMSFDDLTQRFPTLDAWERGDQMPTLKQLERFAHVTHTAVGFLFLPRPPEEQVPLPDYRTIGDAGVRRPSADLLDTIYQCKQRQEWYRDFVLLNREPSVPVVGSLSTAVAPQDAAHSIRAALRFDVAERGSNWTDALRVLIEHAEDLGFLIMVSGVVGSNTHRKLDPGEFRGFALADQHASLIFVNGADTKAAQIFTLLHELAHLWLGDTALDDASLATPPTAEIERWCNAVAAEVLLPLSAIRDQPLRHEPLATVLEQLARQFKVSTLVVLRRLYDARQLNWDEYQAAYTAEYRRVMEILGQRAAGGGNFFNTQPARVSRRFARAVVASTLEGQTLYRDAMQMLGFKKVSTLYDLASHLGIG